VGWKATDTRTREATGTKRTGVTLYCAWTAVLCAAMEREREKGLMVDLVWYMCGSAAAFLLIVALATAR